MKTVVFASVHDAARSRMAAAFFNAFALQSLVRGVSAGAHSLPSVRPEIVEVMKEIGLDVPEPQELPESVLESAALIVSFAEDRPLRTPAGVPSESWDLPDPANLPVERIREIRDRLRHRVWRLVAKRGWYRLQPTQIVHQFIESRRRTAAAPVRP